MKRRRKCVERERRVVIHKSSKFGCVAALEKLFRNDVRTERKRERKRENSEIIVKALT